jgi:hypothetical protein
MPSSRRGATLKATNAYAHRPALLRRHVPGWSMVKQVSGRGEHPATVAELVGMMNKRPGVTARFAQGDEFQYLSAVEAAASHIYLGDGESLILIREDVGDPRRCAVRMAAPAFCHQRLRAYIGRRTHANRGLPTVPSKALSDRLSMKTVAKVKITRMIPLFERQILMVHVATGDINRDWLGPVDLQCGQHTIRMRCAGVGETGGEPAVMLRPEQSDPRTIQDIVAAMGGHPPCSLAIERVFAIDARMD